MSQSLEYKVEEFAIQSISGTQGLPLGIQIAHHDNTEDAETERIIVKATAGEQELEGPQCYPVSLSVELRTTNRNAEYVESVFTTIWNALKPDGIFYGVPYATQQLDPLIYISEVGTDNRQDSKNTRNRSRTITFKALEKTS